MFILYILTGFLGGILAGMGMGGGTILIPLLSLFVGIAQKQAQFINVFSFVIMSLFIIYIHLKNKFVKVFPALIFSFFGTIFATISAIFVQDIPPNTLKVCFGVFLLIIAIWQLIALIIKKNQKT